LVNNVTNMRTLALELHYDPKVVQVVDADPVAWGVQVAVDPAFLARPSTITRNDVDTDNGVIYFEATVGGGTISGNARLFTIDWRPQTWGTTQVVISKAQLATDGGQPIGTTPQNGTIEITSDCVCGQVILQGRTNYSGVAVTSSTGAQAMTDAEGKFAVSGGEPVTVNALGYLTARADPGTVARHASIAGADAKPNVGTITLLAGDVNQDNAINIFDLAQIASRMDSGEKQFDLNGDGMVNVMDLAMAANNYGRQGPQTDWQ